MLSSLFDPRLPKSEIDSVTLATLAFQVILFMYLPRQTSTWFFTAYFAFWRLMYNAGLGYILHRQSVERWIVNIVHDNGWLDTERRPRVAAWARRQFEGKMGRDYDFEVCAVSAPRPSPR